MRKCFECGKEYDDEIYEERRYSPCCSKECLEIYFEKNWNLQGWMKEIT